MTVEAYADAAHAFLHQGEAPDPRRGFHDCGYLPMVELLRYLEANGFTNYIVSGGDRDFMRPVTETMYGIPPERVIGSAIGLRYQEDEHGGTVVYQAAMDVLRRRPGEAGADLEPHRPPADPRRRQLERRHRDAAVRRRPVPPGAAAAGPARRRRARVRLHRGRGEGARARRRRRAGPWSASRTTGPPSSPASRRRAMRRETARR